MPSAGIRDERHVVLDGAPSDRLYCPPGTLPFPPSAGEEDTWFRRNPNDPDRQDDGRLLGRVLPCEPVPVITLRKGLMPDALAYTIAHELYHVWRHVWQKNVHGPQAHPAG